MVLELADLARRLMKALLAPFLRPLRDIREVAGMAPGLGLLVLAMLLVAALVTIRGSRLGALALIPLSAVWLVVNAPFEGPTLLVISYSHGITTADLLSVVALMISTWRLGQAVLQPLRQPARRPLR
jgi:hypothetical protein